MGNEKPTTLTVKVEPRNPELAQALRALADAIDPTAPYDAEVVEANRKVLEDESARGPRDPYCCPQCRREERE